MKRIESAKQLTHRGALAMLVAAIEEAEAIGQPQCIVIVDASGEVLAEIRMSGAKFLSMKSARAKARTAASIGAETTSIPEAVRIQIGLATGGAITGLPGGLPIVVGGQVIGGIGVGSGRGEQDIAVARAGLAAVGGDL